MIKSNNTTVKTSYADKIFDIINVIVMIILLVIFVWPLWFIVIASVSNPNEVWNGNVRFGPRALPWRLMKQL